MSNMSFQPIDIATSSTVDVASLHNGLPCLVHLGHLAAPASELNEQVLEDAALPLGFAQRPTTPAHQAAFATSIPRKRVIFPPLGQRVEQASLDSNIDLGVLWNNIAPSIPEDWGHCSLGTLTSQPQPIKGQDSAKPSQKAGDYPWTLGEDLRSLQIELKTKSLLGNPTSPKSKIDGDTKDKPPSTISPSLGHIRPTPRRPTSIAGVDKTVLAPHTPPPSVINGDYIQHTARTPNKLHTSTPGLQRTSSSQSGTSHTLSSPATTARSSPVISDLGDGRSWSEFSGLSLESGRFSPATSPPSSPVAARPCSPWQERTTLHQKATVKDENVNGVLDGDSDNGSDIFYDDVPVLRAPETNDDSDCLGRGIRAISPPAVPSNDRVASVSSETPVACASSYADHSSHLHDDDMPVVPAAKDLWGHGVVATPFVAEIPQRVITKRHRDSQDLPKYGIGTGTKQSAGRRGRQKTAMTQPKPKLTPGRTSPASFPLAPVAEQRGLSRVRQRKQPTTEVNAVRRPSLSRGIGNKRPASTEHLRPAKRQATDTNAVHRRAVVPSRIKLLKWQNDLLGFEQLLYKGTAGPGEITRMVMLFKEMTANLEVIDDKWVMTAARTRGYEHKTMLALLEVVVDGYGQHDAEGRVALHAGALLTKWRRLM
ncbi:hypothetical protein B0H12DRAFT_1083769 [Mycena haematopus]|nr:hypothetical protein B0H12DRAFT_1083769 [Mycena haematopus]